MLDISTIKAALRAAFYIFCVPIHITTKGQIWTIPGTYGIVKPSTDKRGKKHDRKSNESRATADLFRYHSQELSGCGGGSAFDPGELPGAHGIYAAGKAARRL